MAAAIAGVRASSRSPSMPGKLTFSVFGKAVARMAVEREAGDRGPQRRVKAVAQSLHLQVRRLVRSRSPASVAAAPRPRDVGHVLGPGAPAVLVPAAVDQRIEPRARAHVECADPLRGVELVAGDRQQVDAERLDVERQLAHRLRGVCVDEHAALVRHGRDLGDRLNRADLVVGVHHADEHRPGLDRPAHVVRGRRRRSASTGTMVSRKPSRRCR